MDEKPKFTQYLKCEFSDPEISDRAKELAAANRRRSAIEQQKKEIDSDLKSQIEAENTKIQRLSDQISQGFEYRDVECRIDLDSPQEGQKTIIRLDTGEEVKVSPMTDEDRQLALELAEQPEPPAAQNGNGHCREFPTWEKVSEEFKGDKYAAALGLVVKVKGATYERANVQQSWTRARAV